MKASDKFTYSVIEQMRKAVEDTGGNEVMFTGKKGKTALLTILSLQPGEMRIQYLHLKVLSTGGCCYP